MHMASYRFLVPTTLVTFISISTGQQVASYSCPPAASGGYVYRSSCYDFVGTETTWITARLRCRNRGGRLAMVTDADLQSWLSSKAAVQFPSRQGVWLGLHDRQVEGRFYWDNYDGNDQPASYFFWAPGEPNNQLGSQDCAYMRRSYGWRWVDIECSFSVFREYSHICEFRGIPPASPTSTQQRSTVGTSSSRVKPPHGQLTVASPTVLPSSATTSAEESTSMPNDRLDNRHHMMTNDSSPGQSSDFLSAALSTTHGSSPGQSSDTLSAALSAALSTTHGSSPPQSSDTLSANLSTLPHGGSPDTWHQEMTTSDDMSPAEVAPYANAVKEVQDAAHESQVVHVAVAIVVGLAIVVPIVAFLLVRRRRLHQLKDGSNSTTVAYTGTGVHGLENPMYSSPLALSAAVAAAADWTTTRLLAAAAASSSSSEEHPPPVAAPAFNLYVDMDTLACSGEDGLESAYAIYAEPFQHQPNRQRGEGEPASCDPAGSLPAHVYAECTPLLPQPQEAEHLNDLSKGCDPSLRAGYGGSFGELRLNVQGDCSGGYEEYRSQWSAYENVEKPGSSRSPASSS